VKRSSKEDSKASVPEKGGEQNEGHDAKNNEGQRETLLSVNPYTEEVMHEFLVMSKSEVEVIIAKTRQTLVRWRETPIAQRTALLTRLASVLREESGATRR